MSGIMEDLFPGPQRFRDIENNYQISSISQNTREMTAYAAQMLSMQASELSRMNNGVKAMASVQGTANVLLRQAVYSLDTLNEELSNLNSTITAGLDRLSSQLLQQQKTLDRIHDAIVQPYATQAKELRNGARRWLHAGMRTTGETRKRHWDHALEDLMESVRNPVGRRDCAAWFDIGWLQWKHLSHLTDAENSFYEAALLSLGRDNPFYTLGNWHLAYMRYLQARYEDSYITISGMPNIDNNRVLLYDKARYAAKTGRTDEAVELLETCIHLHPPTILMMLVEVDFQSIPQVQQLAHRMHRAAQESATIAARECRDDLREIDDICSREGIVLDELPASRTALDVLDSEIPKSDYLEALTLPGKAKQIRDELLNHATARVSELLADSKSTVAKLNATQQNARRACNTRNSELNAIISKARSDHSFRPYIAPLYLFQLGLLFLAALIAWWMLALCSGMVIAGLVWRSSAQSGQRRDEARIKKMVEDYERALSEIASDIKKAESVCERYSRALEELANVDRRQGDIEVCP